MPAYTGANPSGTYHGVSGQTVKPTRRGTKVYAPPNVPVSKPAGGRVVRQSGRPGAGVVSTTVAGPQGYTTGTHAPSPGLSRAQVRAQDQAARAAKVAAKAGRQASRQAFTTLKQSQTALTAQQHAVNHLAKTGQIDHSTAKVLLAQSPHQAGQTIARIGLGPTAVKAVKAAYAGKQAPAISPKQAQKIAAKAAQQKFAKGKATLPGLDAQQTKIAVKVLKVGQKSGANRKALVAGIAAGLDESTLRNLNYGDASSTGVFQLLSSTAQGTGINPRSVKQSAAGFFQRGYYGKGGAVALSKTALPASMVAQDVQGSATASGANYAAQVPAAKKVVGAYLHGTPASQATPVKITKNGPLIHPFPKATIGRTDMGVDFTGSGPIRAMGNGKVIRKDAPGWPNGGAGPAAQGIAYTLTDGPLKGKAIYVNEGITLASNIGKTVRKGQVIGKFYSGSSIETGFADSTGQPTDASIYHEGMVTPAGSAMRDLLTGKTVTLGTATGGSAAFSVGSGVGTSAVSTGASTATSGTASAAASSAPTRKGQRQRRGLTPAQRAAARAGALSRRQSASDLQAAMSALGRAPVAPRAATTAAGYRPPAIDLGLS